jgi:amino acid transporter
MSMRHIDVHEKAPEVDPAAHGYGLRHDALSPLEVLAQSVSTIAPSTTPTLTVPLVFALAGNGSWLAYVIAMAAMLLVAVPVAMFARRSASPGSLYVYTRDTLPPAFGSLAALALLFAYVATASSVIGGFINSCQIFLVPLGLNVPPVVLAAIAALGALLIALGDVSISARVMLWIEFASVALIAVVIALVLARHGIHIDAAQIHLAGATTSGVRLGVMLAIFSFVGFESATTLGAEARDPLRTIPRAVVLSAITAGIFFILCTYAETLGFHHSPTALGDSTAPMRWLADAAHVGFIGPAIDAGVLVSMFAATLACIIAAARVLLIMAHEGLAHRWLRTTHTRTGSPAAAVAVTALLALLAPVALALHHVSGADIYGLMGSLAVFAFLTAYGLAGMASIVFLKRRNELTPLRLALASVTVLVILLGLVFSVYPKPPAPYLYLPYLYAAYVALGLVWIALSRRKTNADSLRE